ncbi:MAG TPA: hypothetical protein PLG15_03230 [Candidatus Gastranaerophilaceae bacterium]|nr:hypothetical protein [Candidatus Gastranaerophilaceae bacterium]HPT41377.1 hypothetical protein [Candidatus Gastranaerophilaceae bacterium]
MNISNIAIKAIGIAGLGAVLYDSHTIGKEECNMNQRNLKTDSVEKTFMDTISLDTPSKTKDIMKKQFLKYKLNENFTTFFTGAAGYVKGFTKMLVNNVIPFGLALGTVATKGLASKACGVGLIGYGLVYLLHDVMGIFKPKKL